MRTIKRRTRKLDPMASVASVLRVCNELRQHCPTLIPQNEQQLWSLLNAVRHSEMYSASDTRSGRPSKWPRETLLEVAHNLRKILHRETNDRISISSFIGLYLRIPQYPSDVIAALENGQISLQEATMLARLTHQRLDTLSGEAVTIRHEIMMTHIKSNGSHASLRYRIKEILGEANIISSETLITVSERVDELLKVDQKDKRHLFYEQIKNLFYAMREVEPNDIDDQALSDFTIAADQLFSVIFAIQQNRKNREEHIQKFCT